MIGDRCGVVSGSGDCPQYASDFDATPKLRRSCSGGTKGKPQSPLFAITSDAVLRPASTNVQDPYQGIENRTCHDFDQGIKEQSDDSGCRV